MNPTLFADLIAATEAKRKEDELQRMAAPTHTVGDLPPAQGTAFRMQDATLPPPPQQQRQDPMRGLQNALLMKRLMGSAGGSAGGMQFPSGSSWFGSGADPGGLYDPGFGYGGYGTAGSAVGGGAMSSGAAASQSGIASSTGMLGGMGASIPASGAGASGGASGGMSAAGAGGLWALLGYLSAVGARHGDRSSGPTGKLARGFFIQPQRDLQEGNWLRLAAGGTGLGIFGKKPKREGEATKLLNFFGM